MLMMPWALLYLYSLPQLGCSVHIGNMSLPVTSHLGVSQNYVWNFISRFYGLFIISYPNAINLGDETDTSAHRHPGSTASGDNPETDHMYQLKMKKFFDFRLHMG